MLKDGVDMFGRVCLVPRADDLLTFDIVVWDALIFIVL